MQTANLHMPRTSGVLPVAKRGSRLIAKTATLEPSTQVQDPDCAAYGLHFAWSYLMAANSGQMITADNPS